MSRRLEHGGVPPAMPNFDSQSTATWWKIGAVLMRVSLYHYRTSNALGPKGPVHCRSMRRIWWEPHEKITTKEESWVESCGLGGARHLQTGSALGAPETVCPEMRKILVEPDRPIADEGEEVPLSVGESAEISSFTTRASITVISPRTPPTSKKQKSYNFLKKWPDFCMHSEQGK